MPQRSFLFIVNGEAPVAATGPDRDPACGVEGSGRKRPHYKSRRGCLACKRRRVKRDLVNTLAFSELWQQVLPWSFQEPYIMCAMLCLAATHLSTLRPQVPRYSDAAAQLLAKSVSLFSEKLSGPMTARNSEPLISVCILMHYISWSRIEFVEKQERLPCHNRDSLLTMHLSNDPLLQLSFGVKGILCEAYRTLAGSGSVFLTTGLYSPVYAIEEAILQQGEDPWRFVSYFIGILDDPLPVHDDRDDPPSRKRQATGHNTEMTSISPQCTAKTQEAAFEGIAQRLSLLFCLVSMSASASHSASQALMRLQLDTERCFFSFPIHYSGSFRELALQGDPRALVMLCHFYRAARILLTGPRTWWARQRSRVIESLILQDLTLRGLETCILDEEL
ncbi:hypothetical protein CIB48_g6218 [Xylaria polymorpha]|nr:hypothetical protein CIB48_g6218 [Xylaria polymorpha]